jgi:hypothetical protein
MKANADALVYAAVYINCRGEDGDEIYLDQDVKALESIASLIRHATEEEEDQLAAAAERALAEELASARPRPDFVHDYAHWMEEMLGNGWVGNRRCPEDLDPTA